MKKYPKKYIKQVKGCRVIIIISRSVQWHVDHPYTSYIIDFQYVDWDGDRHGFSMPISDPVLRNAEKYGFKNRFRLIRQAISHGLAQISEKIEREGSK